MNESRTLERRYRRLIALYPRRFRQAREEEMLAVLMSGARDDQRWPRPAEIVNLTRHAAPSRLRNGPPPETVARRYPRSVLAVRLLLGIWLLILTVLLTRKTLWGLTVLLAEALNIYLAARAYLFMHDRNDGGGAQPPSTISPTQ
jgi:hypothetical protein